MSSTLSIITINYNNEAGLAKTLQSVKDQTAENFEYIVVDGNSNDGSVEIIEKNIEFIDQWISEPDSGVYNAMNKGIRMAKGDFLLFLNSGDTLAKNDVINKIIPSLDEKSDIVYGNLIYSLNGIPQTLFTPSKDLRLSYFLHSFLPHPSSFIKRNLFERVGFYNENFKIVSDWEFFLKAVVVYKAKYKYINIAVSDFDNAGISSNDANKTLTEKEKKQVYNELFPNLSEEIDLLHFAGSRRMLQIRNIQNNHPFLWKLLKASLNFLNLFVDQNEEKAFKKLS